MIKCLDSISFKNYRTDVIFTPTSVAKINYIDRSEIEEQLTNSIEQIGKQVIVYGRSGSGKTTIIINKLASIKKKNIKVHCNSNTTFNDILLTAFDSLDIYYTSEQSKSDTKKISSSLKTTYNIISGSLNSTLSSTDENKQIRLVPPQLTAQKLAEFLNEIKVLLILEDFQKVKKAEKIKIADLLKIFVDFPNTKIICIGAVNSANQLIQLDTNLENRVAQVRVPLFTDEQLCLLTTNGCRLMNISMSVELTDKIVFYSKNLASITHQLCYDLCLKNKIKRTKFFKRIIPENDLGNAIQSYIESCSDTYYNLYDKIACDRDFGWYILKTFDYQHKTELSAEEINYYISSKNRPELDELENYLNELRKEEYKNFLSYNETTKKYFITSQFFRTYLSLRIADDDADFRRTKLKKRNQRNKAFLIDKSDKSLFEIYMEKLADIEKN